MAVAGPPPAAAPVPARPRRQSLAEIFGDLAKPAVDEAPAAGAVDLRRLRPSRETVSGPAAIAAKGQSASKAGLERPAAPPSHPSRIWVQIATGRDKGALAYDWRRMARTDEALFKGKRAWVSAWNQTNRLLTGPFESEAAANGFIAQLRRADIQGAFVWTSPAGQVVDGLGGR